MIQPWSFSVLLPGACHALAQPASLDELVLQMVDLPIEQIVGQYLAAMELGSVALSVPRDARRTAHARASLHAPPARGQP